MAGEGYYASDDEDVECYYLSEIFLNVLFLDNIEDVLLTFLSKMDLGPFL